MRVASGSVVRVVMMVFRELRAKVGKDFSLSPRTDAQITDRAEGMADMFSAYVVALDAR